MDPNIICTTTESKHEISDEWSSSQHIPRTESLFSGRALRDRMCLLLDPSSACNDTYMYLHTLLLACCATVSSGDHGKYSMGTIVRFLCAAVTSSPLYSFNVTLPFWNVENMISNQTEDSFKQAVRDEWFP